jgi:hypothetical protein
LSQCYLLHFFPHTTLSLCIQSAVCNPHFICSVLFSQCSVIHFFPHTTLSFSIQSAVCNPHFIRVTQPNITIFVGWDPSVVLTAWYSDVRKFTFCKGRSTVVVISIGHFLWFCILINCTAIVVLYVILWFCKILCNESIFRLFWEKLQIFSPNQFTWIYIKWWKINKSEYNYQHWQLILNSLLDAVPTILSFNSFTSFIQRCMSTCCTSFNPYTTCFFIPSSRSVPQSSPTLTPPALLTVQ